MVDDVIYPAFSEQEFTRRYESTWTRMDERGLDALVVYGDSSGFYANASNCRYLTGYLDRLFSYVIVPKGREPILLASNPLYLPTAEAMGVAGIIDHATWDPGERIAEVLKAQQCAHGAVGLVGVAGIQRATMPYEHMRAMEARLAGVTWKDATGLMQEVRRIKSAEEIEFLRRGARITDATLEALEAHGRTGMTDSELAGIICGAGFAQGGEQRTLFVGSTPMDDPRILFPRQQPSQRVTRPGDIFLTELSTEWGGYSGQVHRPLVVDAEPSPEYLRLFEVARAVYDNVLAALGPGATDEDFRRAASAPLKEAGVRTMDATLHGWGLALEPPRLDVTEVSTIQRPQEPTVFEPGMVAVLQPHPISPDERRGLQLGSVIIITDDGVEALQQRPMEFGLIRS